MAVKGEKHMNTILFSISLVFQLSGAILLILNYFTNTKRNITCQYFSFEGLVKPLDKNMDKIGILDTARLASILQNIFLNRAAFIYLVVGYAVTILGNNESNNKYLLALIVIIISIIMSIITYKIIEGLANKKSKSTKYTDIERKDMFINALVYVPEEESCNAFVKKK
jgi:Na+/melibiose symporter-like transporter